VICGNQYLDKCLAGHSTKLECPGITKRIISFETQSKSESYNGRSVGQSVLVCGTSHQCFFIFHGNYLKTFAIVGCFHYGAPSLTRGRVCCFQCSQSSAVIPLPRWHTLEVLYPTSIFLHLVRIWYDTGRIGNTMSNSSFALWAVVSWGMYFLTVAQQRPARTLPICRWTNILCCYFHGVHGHILSELFTSRLFWFQVAFGAVWGRT
jgi:hypothetical protein